MPKSVLYALTAAALFGASTPLAKLLLGHTTPVALAGLLYLGSGTGLLVWFLMRWAFRGRPNEDRLTRADAPWLGGAILFGGILAPVLLLAGLSVTAASRASLLLNMESVFTGGIAWLIFREHTSRRTVSGMAFLIAGGVLLAWGQQTMVGAASWGPLAILAACLCWAIDNNLTRKVAAGDAIQIAGIKGLVAGCTNLTIALGLGASLPHGITILTVAGVGFLGYGLSLVLFILALRDLGTARTGAYFSVAPFLGAVISLLIAHAGPSLGLLLAGALMGCGLWLHFTERHGHGHTHEPIEHAHPHRHDAHHQHAHDAPWKGNGAHLHRHRHEALTHSHAHFPDIHHRHRH